MLCRDVSVVSHDTISCALHPAVTNLFQELGDGMESRTAPIQEGENDEDIAMLDTHATWPSQSYKSSPTQLPCLVRIQ